MGMLTLIAKHAGWEVTLDTNSIVCISFNRVTYVHDFDSAYEAIKRTVKSPEVRNELLKQWAAHMNGGSRR